VKKAASEPLRGLWRFGARPRGQKMSDEPNKTKPVTMEAHMLPDISAGVAAEHKMPLASAYSWWDEFKQESYPFGFSLVGIGLVLAIPSIGFIRGIAGNIVAAGLVLILFRAFKALIEWMKESPDPKIQRFIRWLLKRKTW
jgi:hypothetical protein